VLNLPLAVRIFLCCQPTDMRRSFDGLCALTQQVLEEDPFSGHLFMFFNRRRDRIKLLYWMGDGLAIWYRRLEKGTFQLPERVSDNSSRLEITASELALILDGIDLSSVKRRRRYRRTA
jgi:transposase